jgi:hypothetical protein
MTGMALLADIKIALLTIMELISLLPAEVAFTFALESGQFQRMLVVAGLQRDRPALKTVADAINVAVHAAKLNALLLLAQHTLIIHVLRTRHVDQHMILLASKDYWTLLIRGHFPTVSHTLAA